MKIVLEFNRKNSSRLIFLMIICFTFIFLPCIKSDLPVHCKREAIDGLWIFHIEDLVFQPSLTNPKTTCGHGFPDRIETTVGDIDFSFAKSTELKIKLNSDYKVYEDDTVVGNWTPVYDEGFILYYKNSIFTAFMKYYKDGNLINSDYVSNCNKTMIGWFIPDKNNNNKDWKCFYGIKEGIVKNKNNFLEMGGLYKSSASDVQHPKMNNNLKKSVVMRNKSSKDDNNSVFNFIKSNSFNFVELQERVDLEDKSNSELNEQIGNELKKKLKYEDQADIVNEINSMNLTWKAGIHEEFKGLSLIELGEHLGLNRRGVKKHHNTLKIEKKLVNHLKHKKETRFIQLKTKTGDELGEGELVEKSAKNQEIEREVDSINIRNIEQVQKYINTEISQMDESILAKNWDWRNVGGVNFVPRLRKQGKCGSCYVFSIVSSLESRLRILSNNNDQTEFSRQFPISCNFYTEGCEGGYPILVGKFFNEFEIVPESCMEYTAENTPCDKVCDYSKNKKKYWVSKYEYLGGFYGATSEVLMMKEIRARGPIPGNISVPWSFSYYKNGIYSHENILKGNTGKLSKTTLFDKNISWEKVDHSILIVGWGEENGIKFWIGMNTWGSNWGEDGFFRILRGENECGVESMGDSFRISVSDRNLFKTSQS